MLLVGLTGGIGSGKSTVAGLLAAKGAHIVDADAVARDVVEPGTPALAKLVERFGNGILDAEGRLDRPALGRLAFVDDSTRKELEAITHPPINHEFLRRIGDAPKDAIVVCDVPLIAESEQARSRLYPVVIVVEAPKEIRLARLEGRGMPRADAESRMKAQATDEERRKYATHIIDNSSDHAALERQVDEVWADVQQIAERHEQERKDRHRGSVRSWGAALRARLRLRRRG